MFFSYFLFQFFFFFHFFPQPLRDCRTAQITDPIWIVRLSPPIPSACYFSRQQSLQAYCQISRPGKSATQSSSYYPKYICICYSFGSKSFSLFWGYTAMTRCVFAVGNSFSRAPSFQWLRLSSFCWWLNAKAPPELSYPLPKQEKTKRPEQSHCYP